MNPGAAHAGASDLPAAPVLSAALLQSLVLFALYRGAEADAAFAVSPLPAYPLWTLAIVLPAQFMLLYHPGARRRRLFAGLLASGSLLLLVAAWTGFQLEPEAAIRSHQAEFAYLPLVTLLAFKLTVWLQAWVEHGRPDYARLLAASWRSFLLPAQAFAFVALFGIVLALWAALFALVGIEFFSELFTEDAFLFPVLGLAFGTGVLLFRRMPNLLGGLDDRLRVAMMLLLPLVLGVGTAFLAVLPFTGIDALWDTGRGTALLLWLVALVTFFLNAVYAPGTDEAYPRWLRGLIGPALLGLPIVAVLAAWGLWLRIGQYGLTVDRFWALVVVVMLGTFACAYAAAVLRLRGRWREGLGPVNVVMSLVLLAILVLAHSPILDPKNLTVRSQLARVERGELALERLDFAYFRRSLGRPGWAAMERIRAAHPDDAALLARLDSNAGAATEAARRDFLADLVRFPSTLVLPAQVRERIADTAGEAVRQDRQGHWVIERDLDRDGRGDFVYLYETGDWLYGLAWTTGGRDDVYVMHGISVEGSRAEFDAARALLAGGEIDPERPRIDDLVLGDLRVRVR